MALRVFAGLNSFQDDLVQYIVLDLHYCLKASIERFNFFSEVGNLFSFNECY